MAAINSERDWRNVCESGVLNLRVKVVVLTCVLDCSRRLDVVNRGLSGYTSSNLLKVLPDLIPDPSHAKVDYIVSHTGIIIHLDV